MIYDKLFNDGQTRTIPISNNASYGVYTIIGFKNDMVTTTKFTVLDITGFQTVTFPHERYFKGITYTFNKDWTLDADKGNDHLKISFKTLQWLVDAYNLDYIARANDNGFLVRMMKPAYDITIDWFFAETHKGLKIIVNGTLDQAREFEMKIEARALEKFLDQARVGNLVFDWSDVKKSGDVFSYNRETGILTVDAPKHFHIDPVIFESGFETGDYSEWTGTITSGSGVIGIITNPVHHGIYASESNCSGAGAETLAYKTISAEETLFAKGDFYFNDTTTDGPVLIWFQRARYTFIAYARFLNVTGNDNVVMIYNYATSAGYWSSKFTLATNTWYSLEFRCTVDNANGILQAWVDDDLKINVTGIDTDIGTDQDVTRVSVGMGWTFEADDIAYDCFVFDDERIGVVNAPPNEPTLVSPANQSTGIDTDAPLTVLYSDPDGDTGTVYYFNNSTGTYLGADTGVLNNTNAVYTWTDLNYSTQYKWHTIANDGTLNSTVSDVFIFTTRDEYTENMILVFVFCLFALMLGVIAVWVPFVGIIGLGVALLVIVPFPITEPAYFIGLQVGTIFGVLGLMMFGVARRMGAD